MDDKAGLKVTTQIVPTIQRSLRARALNEGRQLQTLVAEAVIEEAVVERSLSDLSESRDADNPRPHVMAAYQTGHEKFAPLYKKLAQ